ncbi:MULTISPECIES: hypothetical protein [Priestia]|jgi:hypothetical protein|uniref:hypothetical protein n=1 Tax=Priestia TaxID=2800373 RepID=UPI000BEC16EC|nr:hypothetical protein [Priestia megaterium]MBE2978874.1 hypothetical protein [Priestia megaterium]MDH2364016.1 hypothetical protein [Priestia megaterium]PEB60620.1 hypothetical protein COM86_28840 [Priestia megaterium]PEE73688.1 hypothetical protein COM81_27260 [Priestia megaterium]PFI86588.1 hypothetical protein COI84_27640 [Priestia megaterium]
MTIIKIKEMLETLLRYEDSEITHTFCSGNNTFSLSYSKELKNFQVKNIETGHIEHFPDVETTSLALYRIISIVEKEVTE